MPVKTRHVDRSLFRNYLRKAQENFETVRDCIDNGRWNAAVMNAVHCGINACDAVTVFTIGLRHAGERHEDAIALLQSLNLGTEVLSSKTRQLSRLLGVKNAAEYEERLMTQGDAQEAAANAVRLLRWAEELLASRNPRSRSGMR